MDKKQIIFSDPIYGFVAIPDILIYQIINHPYFQRLRRIKQLGLTSITYPGAMHTRFQHAMGAMYLTTLAIEVLRSKGIKISEEESQGVAIAVLLHDIGHGPFSHALESSIVHGISHEDISEMFLSRMNKYFNGKLFLAKKIFSGTYRKKFLHQLISSQLDMDRLDYLNRDSFFTGVSEGVINSERIIKMLNVVGDELVIEGKGMYSIENFIISRRLMYWQVYLHKTVLSAEYLLVNILRRAKELASNGEKLFCTPALQVFLYNKYDKKAFSQNHELLDVFAQLDDYDIFACVKVWMGCHDFILSTLCKNLINRKLYKVKVQDVPFTDEIVNMQKKKIQRKYKLKESEVDYFVFSHTVKNDAYCPDKIRINILFKNGTLADIADASDRDYIVALQKTVEKYFLYYPKD